MLYSLEYLLLALIFLISGASALGVLESINWISVIVEYLAIIPPQITNKKGDSGELSLNEIDNSKVEVEVSNHYYIHTQSDGFERMDEELETKEEDPEFESESR